jgi:hypothetical protein
MRQTRRAIISAAAISLICLTAAGCSIGSDTSGTRHSDASDAHPDGNSLTNDAEYQLLEVRSGLEDLHAVKWSDWELNGAATIRMHFSTGPGDCYAATSTVEETEANVNIDLAVGTIPGSGECTAIMMASAVDITLDRALGDRTGSQSSG